MTVHSFFGEFKRLVVVSFFVIEIPKLEFVKITIQAKIGAPLKQL